MGRKGDFTKKTQTFLDNTDDQKYQQNFQYRAMSSFRETSHSLMAKKWVFPGLGL